MEHFKNFSELERHAKAGEDFRIEMREGSSGIGIMAPHGGGIEPGTDAAANAIAVDDHAYYAFKGIRPQHNSRLHIASSRFNEPGAMTFVRQCHTIITIHGCRETEPIVYVGGRNHGLKEKVVFHLKRINIPVGDTIPRPIKGLHRNNLCNRGTGGKGVQIEISSCLRRQFIGAGGQQYHKDAQLASFAKAVRQALEKYCAGTYT